MVYDEDIVIVGGGPAGAYCGLELAARGFHPVIFDHSHPREKPCGGGITAETVDRFPFVKQFVSSGGVPSVVKMISCTNRQLVTKNFRAGFNISRRILDEGILNAAVMNGARVVKEKVTDVGRKAGVWNVKTSSRELSSRILVGADGVTSLVRRKTVGPINGENLWIGYGYLVTGVEPDIMVIKFLNTIPGYIWVFPRGNHSSVGIGSEIKNGGKLKNILDKFVKSYYPQIRAISSYAAMIPMAKKPSFFSLPCSGKDWILIGDAAGHADPTTGEGILYALWSGKLAAEAISRGDSKSFDRSWRNAYGDKFKKSCENRDRHYNPLNIELSFVSRSLAYIGLNAV